MKMQMKMSRILKYALVLFISTALLSSHVKAHKFYMSITDMEYNPDNKSLQIVMKLFTDDIEKVLEKENYVRIILGAEKEHPKTDEYLYKYIGTHFFIEQSKGSKQISFVGKEVDKDYTWVYLEVKNFKVKDETLISNSMLLDYFSEQTNKVNYNNTLKTISFTLFKNNISKEF
ncbi:MAG: putative adenine nucleotide alpha hydrolase (AANH) superfamily ATPase [Vicingaceae bacterium]|jgi:predicted adenine nucleotide alpha hydrolase (AANH) superfamily ATPase